MDLLLYTMPFACHPLGLVDSLTSCWAEMQQALDHASRRPDPALTAKTLLMIAGHSCLQVRPATMACTCLALMPACSRGTRVHVIQVCTCSRGWCDWGSRVPQSQAQAPLSGGVRLVRAASVMGSLAGSAVPVTLYLCLANQLSAWSISTCLQT